MAQKILTWCDNCGTKTDALTNYWQLTDSANRTTESFVREKYKLELCDSCLLDAQEEFQSKRKFVDKPRHST